MSSTAGLLSGIVVLMMEENHSSSRLSLTGSLPASSIMDGRWERSAQGFKVLKVQATAPHVLPPI